MNRSSPRWHMFGIQPVSFVVCLRLVALVALVPVAAVAQVGAASTDPWEQARQHYGAQEFEEALPWIIEAAQRDPNEARYVVSIARVYFQLGEYDEATWFYDMYLGMNLDPAWDDRYSSARVRGERNAANNERNDPDAEVPEPRWFDQLSEALETRLDGDGPVLTEGGGGAWAAWEALLRIGYVSGDLAATRTRLADALLREARDLMAPGEDGRMPQMDVDAWRTQQLRFQRARSVLPQPLPFDREESSAPMDTLDTSLASSDELRGWRQLCEGQIAWLNQNYDQAGAAFESAASLIDDEALPLVGLLNVRITEKRRADELILKLDELGFDQLADVYRALTNIAAGDRTDGASRLADLILEAMVDE